MQKTILTISVAAKKAGVGVETIRYYQRIGLVDEPEKPATGYRVYSEELIARLCFIQRAKELGFSLSEISTLLEPDDGNCPKIKELASLKLNMIKDKISNLQAIANTLENLIQCCEDNQNQQICPIINAITINH